MNPFLIFSVLVFVLPFPGKGLRADELLADWVILFEHSAAFAKLAVGPSEHSCTAFGETNLWT